MVVADRQLNFGDVLTKDFVKEVSWPANTVPEGAFTKIDHTPKTDLEVGNNRVS